MSGCVFFRIFLWSKNGKRKNKLKRLCTILQSDTNIFKKQISKREASVNANIQQSSKKFPFQTKEIFYSNLKCKLMQQAERYDLKLKLFFLVFLGIKLRKN